MFMLLMSISLSLTMLFLSHPLSLGLILLIQTIMVSLITGKLCMSYWFSYILFLILIGGMLILFIYMTSIASNEKFNYNWKISLFFIIPASMTVIKENIKLLNYSNINNSMSMFNMNMKLNISMIKYIHMPTNLIMMFMIIYLFLTLIAIVKIINISNGPLRSKN